MKLFIEPCKNIIISYENKKKDSLILLNIYKFEYLFNF